MEDLSLHILDIVENALKASATNVEIVLTEDTEEDLLEVQIRDNGEGMDSETTRRACDPFFTTRKSRRFGFGLPFFAQAAREAGGSLHIESEPGKGTAICARFRLSHPDLKPLGDLAETFRAVCAGRPDVELSFEYRRNKEVIAKLSSTTKTEADPGGADV